MISEVLQTRFEERPSGCRELCAVFTAGKVSHTVYFRSQDAALVECPEALAAAGILPAMRLGAGLRVDGAMDPVFFANLEEIQNLYAKWNSSIQPVQVLSDGMAPAACNPGKQRVGLFFSGGVDSFYSLLKHQDAITDLIFVHGFDIRPDDIDHGQYVERHIRRVGERFGKRVVVVKTNLRLMLDAYAGWGETAHGAAMAAVAHLLHKEFRRIYISASDSFPAIAPWGSHPQLDPLWSASGLEFIHDGYESDRLDKIRRIVTSDAALQNLRVCWKNRKGALNCGRCEKCIRTMIGLRIAGALKRSPVFETPFSMRRVWWSIIPHPDIATSQINNLAALKEMPKERWLYRALSFSFFRSRLKLRIRKIFSFRK